MKNAVLAVALMGLFVFGYFLMGKLDKFLEENRRATKTQKQTEETEVENQSASCVMLTGELSDEEITDELRRFRKKHENARIMIYDEEDTSPIFTEEPSSDKKQ